MYLLEFYTGTAHNTILGYVIPDDTPEIHYKRVAGEWFPIA